MQGKVSNKTTYLTWNNRCVFSISTNCSMKISTDESCHREGNMAVQRSLLISRTTIQLQNFGAFFYILCSFSIYYLPWRRQNNPVLWVWGPMGRILFARSLKSIAFCHGCLQDVVVGLLPPKLMCDCVTSHTFGCSAPIRYMKKKYVVRYIWDL